VGFFGMSMSSSVYFEHFALEKLNKNHIGKNLQEKNI